MRTSLFPVIIAMITAVAGSSGCAGIWPEAQQQQKDNIAAAKKTADARKLMQENKFTEAIALYRRMLQEHPNAESAPEAKYFIALAYASADNPRRDYAVALTEFDEFLAQHPSDRRVPEAKSWRQALKVLVEAKKDNERLNKNIERLKQLDVRQEEKRLGR